MPDVLTFIIHYLQLKTFLDTNKDALGETAQSALDTVQGNIEWLNKYGADISAWLTKYEPNVTTDAPGVTTGVPDVTTGVPDVTTTDGSGNIATNTILITIVFNIALLHITQLFN
jgi:hypothetical protein